MLILVDKFSHTVGGLEVGLLWVGFGVMWSGLGFSNWGGRCKTFLLPIPYVWEIRPALLGLGRSYLILKVTDHRSPITDHRSPITDHQSPITNHRSPITDAFGQNFPWDIL